MSFDIQLLTLSEQLLRVRRHVKTKCEFCMHRSQFWSIGLLRRLRDSARIVETAHVVVSEIYTDGSGKQQKAQGHSLASMKKRNLKFG